MISQYVLYYDTPPKTNKQKKKQVGEKRQVVAKAENMRGGRDVITIRNIICFFLFVF